MRGIGDFVKKKWPFIFGSVIAPVTYLFYGYCGGGCPGCPGQVACSAGVPIIFGLIFILKIKNRLLAFFTS